MLVIKSSVVLILAAPSIASSFVAATFTKHNPVMTIAIGPSQRRSGSSTKDFHRIWSVSPGGSSEAQSTPTDDDNPVPITPPAPPTLPESPASDVSATIPPPPAAVAGDTSTVTVMGPNSAEPGILRKTFSNLPWHRLPNVLTYIRCLAIPALVVLFYLPNGGNGSNIASGVIFGLASATDWLDGYLARRWDITSPFGAFLDPVADKLMVSTSLILLAGRFGKVVAIPSLIILAREIAVSALREWMAQRGQRDVVKVGIQGKVKTALTMVALTMLLFVPAPAAASQRFFSALYQPALILLYLCVVVTVTSGSVYFRAAAPALLEK